MNSFIFLCKQGKTNSAQIKAGGRKGGGGEEKKEKKKKVGGGLFPLRLEHFTDVRPAKQDASRRSCNRLGCGIQAAPKDATTAGLQLLEETGQHPC